MYFSFTRGELLLFIFGCFLGEFVYGYVLTLHTSSVFQV